MRHNAHIENEDRSTVLMAEWIELNPKPNRRLNRCTITAELWLALFLGLALLVLMSSWSYTWTTDEEWEGPSPHIEDEAQTAVSQGRVEL